MAFRNETGREDEMELLVQHGSIGGLMRENKKPQRSVNVSHFWATISSSKGQPSFEITRPTATRKVGPAAYLCAFP
jgi:hypothetical protein